MKKLNIDNMKIYYTSDAKPIIEWMERELELIAKDHGEDVEIKVISKKY